MCGCGKALVRETTKAGRTTTEKKPAKKPWIEVAQREPVRARPEREAHQETAEDAVCGARPERQAHQETVEKDAVCGAKAGRQCRGRTRDGSTSSDVETCKTGIGTKVG